MNSNTTLHDLRDEEYRQRLKVNRLRRAVYEQPDPSASPELLSALQAAERTLREIEQKRAAAQAKEPEWSGLVLDTDRATGLLGAKTTGLDATVHLRMAQVPTSIVHLFNPKDHPLVTCRVRNAKSDGGTRRLRVISFIDGYSAHAVDTVELDPLTDYTFHQLPTLFPERVRNVTELTRATLNVLVEDLDPPQSGKIELHKTCPIWLLARTTAPLAVQDPKTGQWQDLTPYFGAFVTPNAPEIMQFLRVAARSHPQEALVGYQRSSAAVKPDTVVEPQVMALYAALKTAGITYVNSVIDFSPEQGSTNQRVRLPRESLGDKQANCIDGTVLFASLLEAISMSPAIVVVPGHAFVAWETWTKSNEWKYLETTMIHSHNFEDAHKSGETTAARYKKEADALQDPSLFRRWPLRVLRSDPRYAITPME